MPYTFKNTIACYFVHTLLLFSCSVVATTTKAQSFLVESLATPSNKPLVTTWVNNAVQVQWANSNETGISHYIIERGVDGVIFKEIALFFTTDKSPAVALQYTFKDAWRVEEGIATLYYRLKTVEKNGGVSYSNTSSIVSSKKN
jgi:hypothetical protein